MLLIDLCFELVEGHDTDSVPIRTKKISSESDKDTNLFDFSPDTGQSLWSERDISMV